MKINSILKFFIYLSLLLFNFGCNQKMASQGHLKVYDESQIKGAESLVRHPPQNTVARGQLHLDSAFYEGKQGNQLIRTNPKKLTRELLNRGQERYNIYCSPCHDYTGSGNGMIVQRGFLPPPSYHLERLRQAPDGHFFDVITHGKGAMYSYADRVNPEDRWAIVAYIRALQFSQNTSLNQLPMFDQNKLLEIQK